MIKKYEKWQKKIDNCSQFKHFSLQTSFKYHMGIILYGCHLGIKTNLKFVNLPWDSGSLRSEIQQVVTHGGGVVKHGCKCFKQATKTRLVNLILNALNRSKSQKVLKDDKCKTKHISIMSDLRTIIWKRRGCRRPIYSRFRPFFSQDKTCGTIISTNTQPLNIFTFAPCSV